MTIKVNKNSWHYRFMNYLTSVNHKEGWHNSNIIIYFIQLLTVFVFLPIILPLKLLNKSDDIKERKDYILLSIVLFSTIFFIYSLYYIVTGIDYKEDNDISFDFGNILTIAYLSTIYFVNIVFGSIACIVSISILVYDNRNKMGIKFVDEK